MTFQEITDIVAARFPGLPLETDTRNPQPALILPLNAVAEVCRFLYEDDRLYFDFLACITSIDNGPAATASERFGALRVRSVWSLTADDAARPLAAEAAGSA